LLLPGGGRKRERARERESAREREREMRDGWGTVHEKDSDQQIKVERLAGFGVGRVEQKEGSVYPRGEDDGVW
jgi:hypothetical protein